MQPRHDYNGVGNDVIAQWSMESPWMKNHDERAKSFAPKTLHNAMLALNSRWHFGWPIVLSGDHLDHN